MGLIKLELRKNNLRMALFWNILVWAFITWVIALVFKYDTHNFIILLNHIDSMIGIYAIFISSILYNKYFISDIKLGYFNLMRSYPIKRNSIQVAKVTIVVLTSLIYSFLIYNLVCIGVYVITRLIDVPLVGFDIVFYMKSQVYILCFCFTYNAIGLIPAFIGTITKSERWMIGLTGLIALGVNSLSENIWSSTFNVNFVLLGLIGLISIGAAVHYINKKI